MGKKVTWDLALTFFFQVDKINSSISEKPRLEHFYFAFQKFNSNNIQLFQFNYIIVQRQNQIVIFLCFLLIYVFSFIKNLLK